MSNFNERFTLQNNFAIRRFLYSLIGRFKELKKKILLWFVKNLGKTIIF